MSELRLLRDHSEPCEHNKEASLLFDVDQWVCDRWDCPGGKLVKLQALSAAESAVIGTIFQLYVEVSDDE